MNGEILGKQEGTDMPENTQEPIRVGIIGLGRSGWGIHRKTFTRIPSLYKIVAVTDIDEKRREEAKSAHGCRAYDDLAAFLKDEDIELVVNATPNYLHTPYTLQALEAGKHVVCEKPFAVTLADYDKVVETARRAGRYVVP